VILADTSVWIDHLRRHNADLAGRLEAGLIMTHSFVIGELACGNMRQRAEFLTWIKALPPVLQAADDEVLQLIERHRLWGRGHGWIDAHLVASALLTRCKFWTLDRSLADTWTKIETRTKNR
jgi:predicted nucleic acid-binding protein